MLPITLCLVIFVAVSECYPEASSRITEELDDLSEGLSSVNEDTVDPELTSYSCTHCYCSSWHPDSSLWPPEEWDWRKLGGVIPTVKNQGNCNAGWAFSVVGAVESHRQIHLRKFEQLSEQFLIDCIEGSGGTHGCNETVHDLSNEQLETYGQIIAKYGGIPRHNDYREYSGNKSECQSLNPMPLPVQVSGFRSIQSDYFEQDMVNYLVTEGPLVAAINSASMKNYTSGIDQPTEDQCNSSNFSMDHFVLIVGYGWETDPNSFRKVPYWIIKNSRGPNWGVSGFYYLVRGRNACGIANYVSLPYVV